MSHIIKDANIWGSNVVDSDEWTKSNTKPVLKESCSSSEVKVFFKDQENTGVWVFFYEDKLNTSCSDSNINHHQNSAKYATSLKGLKLSDINVSKMKKVLTII